MAETENREALELTEVLRVRRENSQATPDGEATEEFNEAKRAAQWIYDNWK